MSTTARNPPRPEHKPNHHRHRNNQHHPRAECQLIPQPCLTRPGTATIMIRSHSCCAACTTTAELESPAPAWVEHDVRVAIAIAVGVVVGVCVVPWREDVAVGVRVGVVVVDSGERKSR